MTDRTVNPEIKEFMMVVRRALLMIVAYIDTRYRTPDANSGKIKQNGAVDSNPHRTAPNRPSSHGGSHECTNETAPHWAKSI